MPETAPTLANNRSIAINRPPCYGLCVWLNGVAEWSPLILLLHIKCMPPQCARHSQRHPFLDDNEGTPCQYPEPAAPIAPSYRQLAARGMRSSNPTDQAHHLTGPSTRRWYPPTLDSLNAFRSSAHPNTRTSGAMRKPPSVRTRTCLPPTPPDRDHLAFPSLGRPLNCRPHRHLQFGRAVRFVRRQHQRWTVVPNDHNGPLAVLGCVVGHTAQVVPPGVAPALVVLQCIADMRLSQACVVTIKRRGCGRCSMLHPARAGLAGRRARAVWRLAPLRRDRITGFDRVRQRACRDDGGWRVWGTARVLRPALGIAVALGSVAVVAIVHVRRTLPCAASTSRFASICSATWGKYTQSPKTQGQWFAGAHGRSNSIRCEACGPCRCPLSCKQASSWWNAAARRAGSYYTIPCGMCKKSTHAPASGGGWRQAPTLNMESHTALAGALSVSRNRCSACDKPAASMGSWNLPNAQWTWHTGAGLSSLYKLR